jgi:hypothetical protein
MWQLG